MIRRGDRRRDHRGTQRAAAVLRRQPYHRRPLCLSAPEGKRSATTAASAILWRSRTRNIGDGTKISHLTYVGDGDLGKHINLGCGVVFSNYDGKVKAPHGRGGQCLHRLQREPDPALCTSARTRISPQAARWTRTCRPTRCTSRAHARAWSRKAGSPAARRRGSCKHAFDRRPWQPGRKIRAHPPQRGL